MKETKIVSTPKNFYVIQNKNKFYSLNEGWTTKINHAWLFSNKKVHGFRIKEDFPKGTQVKRIKFTCQYIYEMEE